MKLHKILNYLNKKVFLLNLKYYSYEEQLEYLNSFPHPKDDIERSYFQYKCQNFVCDGFFISFVKNLSSFFITIYYLIKIRDCSNVENITISDNVLVGARSLFNFLPKEYKESKNLLQREFMDSMSLNVTDRKFAYSLIRRYPLSWYFLLKTIVKLAYYSSLIERYNPQNILASCEYSFTSSILTYYCESRNVNHINFMHGEKIFNIREAFCRFTEFYLWDKYYMELFRSLRSLSEKYIVEIPEYFLVQQVTSTENGEKEKVDYKFYLTIEDKHSIIALKKVIFTIINMGKKVKIRPHPSQINKKMLYEFLDNRIIEDPYTVDIISSLDTTRNVVSIGSSVLYQAYLREVPVIIDDVTNKERYKYFKENKHIMNNKKHKILSEILADEAI